MRFRLRLFFPSRFYPFWPRPQTKYLGRRPEHVHSHVAVRVCTAFSVRLGWSCARARSCSLSVYCVVQEKTDLNSSAVRPLRTHGPPVAVPSVLSSMLSLLLFMRVYHDRVIYALTTVASACTTSDVRGILWYTVNFQFYIVFFRDLVFCLRVIRGGNRYIRWPPAKVRVNTPCTKSCVPCSRHIHCGGGNLSLLATLDPIPSIELKCIIILVFVKFYKYYNVLTLDLCYSRQDVRSDQWRYFGRSSATRPRCKSCLRWVLFLPHLLCFLSIFTSRLLWSFHYGFITNVLFFKVIFDIDYAFVIT